MTTEPSPTLVVVRGNSGSGKTSTAREVRRRYGRGAALIEQDYLRRIVLREHDSGTMPTIAPAFITATAHAALAAGYHVVLEGILHTGQYATPLRKLITEHPGRSYTFWMDVSFDETVRRHHRRPEPIDVSAEQMRAWFTPLDLLGVPGEQVIEEASTLEETVSRILHDTGLADTAALTPCPTKCPSCAQKHQAATPTDEHERGQVDGPGQGTMVVDPGTVASTRPDLPREHDAQIWDAVALAREWLDRHNGEADPELGLRILKVVEEAGEAAAAWIGTIGQNPRKGVTHSRRDVADELGDVAFTALVAAASLGFHPQDVLAQVSRKVRARLPDTSTAHDGSPPDLDARQ